VFIGADETEEKRRKEGEKANRFESREMLSLYSWRHRRAKLMWKSCSICDFGNFDLCQFDFHKPVECVGIGKGAMTAMQSLKTEMADSPAKDASSWSLIPIPSA
jgi:hypothetical protein